VPIAATLTEIVGVVYVVASAVAEEPDAAIGADAGAPRAHAVSEALRHREVRAVRPAVVGIFPSGAVGVIAGAIEQHSEALGIRESLRVDLCIVMVVASVIVEQADAQERRALRSPVR